MKQITDLNIEEILKTEKLVIIDFSAKWCSGCVAIKPTIEELSNDYENEVVIGDVNVDENLESSKKYGIRSIPALIFIKNGEVVYKMIGTHSKTDFIKKIEELK